MKIVLHLKNLENQTRQELIFDRLPLLFGRSKICDVSIQDPILSRQHCVVEAIDSKKIKLVDYNSANGTFFKNQRIQEQALDVGQSFVLGNTEVKIGEVDLTEEITLEEILPQEESTAPKKTQIDKRRAVDPALTELTLKTPTVLKQKKAPTAVYKTKDWVQVSLLWKAELVDIQCFDVGSLVTLGASMENNFIVAVPQLPAQFQFLKILPNGVEIHLHPSMKGVVETRGQVRSLDDLRMNARQTDIGFSVFVQFDERLLIEIGPFAVFIQSVRLKLTAPLTAPLVKEPLFAGILGSVLVASLAFFIFLYQIIPQPGVDEPVEEVQPTVKVETPKISPPPPPPPRKTAKTGAERSQKQDLRGHEGAGAKAKGEEGSAGRTQGSIKKPSRPIGMVSKKPPARSVPKGGFGEHKDRSQARRGLTPSHGTGTAKPKPSQNTSQAPSQDIRPKVNVDESGVLGPLGGKGGGGTSTSGGAAAGQGLGGELESSVEGLERGADIDSRGAGGRGTKGLNFGGGGSAIEVGGLSTAGKGSGRTGFGLGSSGKKGEAEVSYSAEDVEVRDGLTRDEIKRVVDAHQQEIQACYEKALVQENNPSLGGRITVDWFVNQGGRAVNIQEASGITGSDYLFRCIAGRIGAWQFPRPRGGLGAQVRWPWVFKRGG